MARNPDDLIPPMLEHPFVPDLEINPVPDGPVISPAQGPVPLDVIPDSREEPEFEPHEIELEPDIEIVPGGAGAVVDRGDIAAEGGEPSEMAERGDAGGTGPDGGGGEG